MIEQTIRDYLVSKFSTIPVYLEKPSEPPIKRIFLERTGTTINNLIKTSTFAIQSYDSSLYEACVLNESVKEAVLGSDSDAGLCSVSEVCGVKLNTDYPYPDSRKNEYRYQAVFEVTHY